MKNYTSHANPGQTAGRIELMLAKFGATRIQKEYKAGEIDAMVFNIPIPTGDGENRDQMIRLPANAEAVERVLRSTVSQYKNWPKEKLHAQAMMTAWKIQQEWVEIQLSMIEMHQLDPLQVFLPYAWDGTRTFYESLQEAGFKMLPQKTGR
jgi:hypothetical protein